MDLFCGLNSARPLIFFLPAEEQDVARASEERLACRA